MPTSWLVILVGLAVLAGLVGGWLGSRLRTWTQRSTEMPPRVWPEPPHFELEHVDGQIWRLRNDGPGTARLVSVSPLLDGFDQHAPPREPRHPDVVTSTAVPTLGPGAAVGVWVSTVERGQCLAVSWTSAANVRMGPVVLEVPGPV